MADAFTIQPHMEVLGSDGRYVGTVDHLQGADIKLTRKDSETGGRHRLIPLSWVDWVEEDGLKVHLNRSRDDAEANWRDA
jgi:hypothetical protein